MITITKTPYKYAPTQNPMIFQFVTNLTTTLYFSIEIKQAVTNKLLAKNKIYISPNQTGSFFDICKILDNVTSTPIDNSDSVLVHLDGTYGYYLSIKGIDANGNVTDPLVTTETFYAFNGKLNNFDLFNGLMNSYFMKSGYEHKFLTDRPELSNLHYVGKEHLYFLADNTSNILNATIIVNYRNNLADTYMVEFDNPNNKLLHRLNMSPRSLSEQLGFNMTNVKNIVVFLTDLDGVQCSVTQTYHIVNYSCKQSIVNLNWINEFGGMSSNTFISPKERKSVEKVNYYGNGYLERLNGVYQPFQRVLSTNINNTYTITSQVLNDEEYDVISNIINSRNVYCELITGELYPIILDTTSVDVLKKKYTKRHNRLQLDFTSNANLKLELFIVPQAIVNEGFDYFLDFIL